MKIQPYINQCSEVPMDNNTAERDMRGPVVGRKNFFGSGALWSGQLAATLYSLFATLKLHGINARVSCALHWMPISLILPLLLKPMV